MKNEEQSKNTYTAYRKDCQCSSFTLVHAFYSALGKEWKVSFLLFLQIRRIRLQHFQSLKESSLPSVQVPSGHIETSPPLCQSRVRYLPHHLNPEHAYCTFFGPLSPHAVNGKRKTISDLCILPKFCLIFCYLKKTKKGRYTKDPMLSWHNRSQS